MTGSGTGTPGVSLSLGATRAGWLGVGRAVALCSSGGCHAHLGSIPRQKKKRAGAPHARAGCGGQGEGDPPAWGWAVRREGEGSRHGTASRDREQSGSGSLLHPPLEGRRMPGTREAPAPLSPRALGTWGKGVPRLGRDEGVSGGLSCPGTVRSDPACARSVLEEGRGAAAEQHGAAHQGGGRAAHLAGAQRAGGRRRPLHGDGEQRGGRHVLQCHPQRAAR